MRAEIRRADIERGDGVWCFWCRSLIAMPRNNEVLELTMHKHEVEGQPPLFLVICARCKCEYDAEPLLAAVMDAAVQALVAAYDAAPAGNA